MFRRLFILIISTLFFCGLAQPGQEYWVRWNGEWTLPQQREIILWFTRHYGVSIGAKCVLKTNRHFQGQLAKEIDDENRNGMRFKRKPQLCTAMVYSGWKNWDNPQRLNRGLVDLQWQMFLKRIINETE